MSRMTEPVPLATFQLKIYGSDFLYTKLSYGFIVSPFYSEWMNVHKRGRVLINTQFCGALVLKMITIKVTEWGLPVRKSRTYFYM